MTNINNFFLALFLFTSCTPNHPNDIHVTIIDDDTNSRKTTAHLQTGFFTKLSTTILASPECFIIEYYNARQGILKCKRLELSAVPGTLPPYHPQHFERLEEIKKVQAIRKELLDTFSSDILKTPRPKRGEKTYTYLNKVLLHVLPVLNGSLEYAMRFLFINTDLEDDTEYSKKQNLSKAVTEEMNAAAKDGVTIILFTENQEAYDHQGLSNNIQRLSHPDDFIRKLGQKLNTSSSLFTQNQ